MRLFGIVQDLMPTRLQVIEFGPGQLISCDESSLMTILGKQQHTPNGQPEKGKPWCNVPNRKTPTHILQRRRDAYYRRKEQKLFETNGQSKPRYVRNLF